MKQSYLFFFLPVVIFVNKKLLKISIIILKKKTSYQHHLKGNCHIIVSSFTSKCNKSICGNMENPQLINQRVREVSKSGCFHQEKHCQYHISSISMIDIQAQQLLFSFLLSPYPPFRFQNAFFFWCGGGNSFYVVCSNVKCSKGTGGCQSRCISFLNLDYFFGLNGLC